MSRSAGAYEGALRRMVQALKYEGRRGLARRLAALMRERGAEVLAGADLAVPVPLHWRRRLARGFNQAEDLAASLGLPVCRALARARSTRPQFGLGLGDRRRNVHGAFVPRRRLRLRVTGGTGRRRPAIRLEACEAVRVAGACVVLVDDLTTTGATLRECAEVLKRLGARDVRALTAARALAPRR
jgi:predicted amidophosphoribosyltransferase